jgi:peptidoglycan/LPS O-acetylase OafA/YrhL
MFATRAGDADTRQSLLRGDGMGLDDHRPTVTTRPQAGPAERAHARLHQSPPERLNNFDYLRLFLALEVVYSHCLHLSGRWPWLPVAPVPAFVCLSGFLIPGSFSASRSWAHFAWKRLLRVVPGFVVSLALLWLLFGWAAVPNALTYYALMGFSAVVTYNGALWSLMLEEILYFVHGVTRTFTRLWTPRFAWISLAVSLGVWAAWRVHGLPVDIERVVAPIVGFLAGCVLQFHKTWLQSLRTSVLVLGGVTLNLIPLLVLLPGPVAVLVGTAKLVSFVAVAYALPQGRLRIPDLSFGLYVYHMPIMYRWIVAGVLNPQTLLLVVLASTVPLAIVSWYLVERPMLSLKSANLFQSASMRPASAQGLPPS